MLSTMLWVYTEHLTFRCFSVHLNKVRGEVGGETEDFEKDIEVICLLFLII